MQSAITLINQTLTMFLLAGIGFLLFKKGKISTEGSRSLGNILIYIVLPCVIVKGFLVDKTPERLTGLWLSALLALLILLLSVLISGRIFRKDPIAAFAGAFSNPGFFGVPLITALLSDGAVFYIAAFIGFLNLLQWTWGVRVMTADSAVPQKPVSFWEKAKATLKRLFCAPFFLAILIGLFLFLTQLPLPGLLMNTLGYIANLNTPLAMFTVGIYLAQTDLKKMFQKKQIYSICLVRLLLIPAVSIGMLYFVPSSFEEMKTAILIASACPVGSNIAVYAQLHDRDYPYAVETVVISTLFSIVTIPLVVSLGQLVFC